MCSVLFALAFSVLAGRLYFLQVVSASDLSSQADNVRKRILTLEAKRGDIVDRSGNLLAGTHSVIQIGVDPHFYDTSYDGKLAVLAGILDAPLPEVREKAGRKYRTNTAGEEKKVRWVPLGDVDEKGYAAIDRLGIQGVYGVRRYERFYPGDKLGAHVVGFVNKDRQAVMGVEESYDFYLSGQSGWLETEVDGRRRELAVFRDRQVEPRDGMHLELTIDLVVQSIIEKELRNIVEDFAPDGASIIVSNPSSGEILGMANYPDFDPNRFWEYPMENQRNRAVTDLYEPGSTFKIVPVAAALEEGLVNVETVIDCSQQRVEYQGISIPMPSDHRNLGKVPVWEIVRKSSNRGTAMIGMELGEQRLYDYASKFGFGQRTHWPLRGEVSGIFRTPEKWDRYMVTRVPTGYAIAATPMQVHLAMSTIANRGVRVDPRLVRRVFKETDETVLRFDHKVEKRIISSDTADDLVDMLKEVVSPKGTAKRAFIEHFEVAGKTGTSRKIIKGRYSESHHYASFSGFFPADNPQLVITIMVDDADTKGPAYGGLVSAPSFKNVGQQLIPYIGIREPEPIEDIAVASAVSPSYSAN